MSGHSKWSKVKHQKASTDVVKGQLFTKASQAITLAVREGGGVTDPDTNFRLRLAIEKAKAVNMPKENIDRAVKRAVGSDAGNISDNLYEGFGPSGSAILIHVVTDNPNRTVSTLKNIMDRFGGTLAAPGAVAHLFTRAGLVVLLKEGHSYDEVLDCAIEAGADDVMAGEEAYEVYTKPAKLADVKHYLESRRYSILESDFVFMPQIRLDIPPDKAEALEKLITELEALDDVVSVYTNTV